MSSFGFVQLPASSSSQSTEKRAKISHHSEEPSPQSADSPSQLQPPKSPQVPQSTSTTFSGNDLGTYSVDKVKVKGLSNEERLWLIRNPCRPDTSYKYPQKEEYGKKRSFQQTWLKQFPWICYSEFCNGGLCINCVLFDTHSLWDGDRLPRSDYHICKKKPTQNDTAGPSSRLESFVYYNFVLC